MRIQSIIYQNISQLKWHILACVGLVMTIPIEDVIVSFINDHEFYNVGTGLITVYFTPFLAGLIACANVQSDLDEKRYVFWRSKPANVKLLMTIKFFVGLIISFILMACPVVFMIIIKYLSKNTIRDLGLQSLLPMSIFLMLIIYSLCFASNVLVRSTARAWLIGILLTGFLLVLPFILPLNYRDFMNNKEVFGLYLVIMLIATGGAFIFSLFAVQYEWHLKTNLKGLLWVIAGLVFVLLMLFSTQVANIKVLQEKEIEPLLITNEVGTIGGILVEDDKVEEFGDYVRNGWIIRSISSDEGEYREVYWESNLLEYIGDKVLFRLRNYVDVVNNKISLSDFKTTSDEIVPKPVADMNGYDHSVFPYNNRLIREINGGLYSFYIYTYHSTIKDKPSDRNIYEKVFLRSYKFTGDSWIHVSELDISECITEDMIDNATMRIVGDKLFAFIDKSFAEVDITNPEDLTKITSKIDFLPRREWLFYYMHSTEDKFTIPLIPAEGIDIEERIGLSIDLFYHSFNMYESSIVDIYDKKISYFLTDSFESIARYEVTGWDQDNINCELKAYRKLTMLEGMTESQYSRNIFVKNGRLYYLAENSLMVFDVRSDNRIRKLGHFVRMIYEIQDIAVLGDDNILLCLSLDTDSAKDYTKNPKRVSMCLLKAP